MIRALSILTITAAALAGCTTATESFPGQAPEHVWSAMVAIAHEPDYDHADVRQRWNVRENAVWVDEPGRRIEVYRELVRRLHRPRAIARNERRDWRFRIELVEDGPVPTATFISRDVSVPAHVWDEAARYFDDVWTILGGRPEPDAAEPAAGAPAASPPAEAAPGPDDVAPLPAGDADETDAPPIDLDDLEADGER